MYVEKQIIYIKVKKMALDCSLNVILLFVLIKYAKTSYFVPVDYIGVVGIQAEKPRSNPHEKYRGVPNGVVIKGCDKEM